MKRRIFDRQFKIEAVIPSTFPVTHHADASAV